MADLAPFDPAATCPKCGHDDVGTGYREGHHYPCFAIGEHLDRWCRRCRYGWTQAVVRAMAERIGLDLYQAPECEVPDGR